MRLLQLPLFVSLWVLGCSLSHSPDLPSAEAGGDGDGGLSPGDGDILVGDGDGEAAGGSVGTGGAPGAGGGPVGTGGSASGTGEGGETLENLGGSR